VLINIIKIRAESSESCLDKIINREQQKTVSFLFV
jgi:hypothetical protein